MKITGVIAEYNPFHNGHKAMLEQCRKDGADGIVAVMSGNFVQRGSVAIMDKRSRAAAALRGGADLVVELPVPWATATAEVFADGGIAILHAIGCVDTLSFGAECADADLLKRAADAVLDPRVDEAIKQELTGGISYPAARSDAVSSVYDPELAGILDGPNNILAVEYIKALKKRHSDMDIRPVLRMGTGHDTLTPTDEFASASTLRILMERGDPAAFEFMPPESVEEFEKQRSIGRAPVRVEESERAILSRLRLLSKEDIRRAPDVSEGLENRIFNAIQAATSLEELYDIIKTRRYAGSRIRRIITALVLGITAEDRAQPVPYIRVLGFNETGREILREAGKTAALPLITKLAKMEELPENARHIFALECRATDLYNLATPRILPCGTEFCEEMVMI